MSLNVLLCLSFLFCALPNMINSVSQVHMVCLAIIHYLPRGCLRMSTVLLLFSSFQLPDVPPYSGDFCTVQIQTAEVTTCVIHPPPVPPAPLTHHTRLPSSHQLLESSQISPASGHPRVPFRLPAVLFPHFPCGSLSSSRSLPQRGLLRPFSSLSCLFTCTTTSHIVTASWSPSPCPPPSTHLHW